MATTIYAVGGGHGHAVRGALIAQREVLSDQDITLIVRQGALLKVTGVDVPANTVELSPKFLSLPRCKGKLIVDTFPLGWSGEIGDSWLKKFEYRIFVARYSVGLDWQQVLQDFDEVWLPYESAANEWQVFPESAKTIGILVKNRPTQVVEQNEKLVLVDTENRCSQDFRLRLSQVATQAGLELEICDQLRPQIHAQKLLMIGAGYNMFYEFLSTRADVRFVPIKKRFDDQCHRVDMYRRGVHSFKQIGEWLRSDFATI